MSHEHDLGGSIYFAQLGCRRWYHIPESLVANMLKAGAIVKRSQEGTEWETIAPPPRIVTPDLLKAFGALSSAPTPG